MKKEKKGLSRKMNFFYDDHEIEKELEKNLRIALMAFVLSPLKQYRSGETKHTKMLSTTLCLHKRQVMLDAANFCSCFTFFFTVFGRETARAIYLGPYCTKS